jgi:hypothetical protein
MLGQSFPDLLLQWQPVPFPLPFHDPVDQDSGGIDAFDTGGE